MKWVRAARARMCYALTMDDDGIKWPTPGMTAFHMKDSGADRTNAWVDGHPNLFVMALAFREASEVIYNHIATAISARNDVLVYPFLFNWRHYLELSMKGLIPLARDYHGLPAEPLKLHHRIRDYWIELLPLIERAGNNPVEDRKLVAAVDAVIAEFVKYDPDSFTFRYPQSKGGDTPLERVPRVIRIEQFHDTMLAIANFFSGVETMMSAGVDARNEYLADARSEYLSANRDGDR